jgi:hypothetical protein
MAARIYKTRQTHLIRKDGTLDDPRLRDVGDLGESRVWLKGGTCHLGTTHYGLMRPMMVTAAVHLFFPPPTSIALPTCAH